MAGGWVLAGQGSRRARRAAGVVAILPVPTYLAIVILLNRVHELATPRGLWVSVLLFSLLAVFTIACSIPRRPTSPCAQPAATPAYQDPQ